MTDILFLLITAGFFGLTVLFVRAIEWIVGPDPVDLTPPTEPLAGLQPDPDPGVETDADRTVTT